MLVVMIMAVSCQLSVVSCQQWVTFTVKPGNAILTVDETRLVLRDGRAMMMLNPGPHKYAAESPYYETLADTFTLKDTVRADILVVMQAAYSYMNVETHYNNAEIYIDQKSIGRGSVKSCRITAGDHRLTVIRDTMCLYDGRVELVKAEKKMVDLAALGVEPFPWDAARWLVPLSALTAEGALADSTLMEQAHAEMEIGECSANVTSNIPGAAIYVDGRLVGNTPLVVPGLVANRKYLVTVRMKGYKDASVVFTAQTNIVGEVKVKLKK